MEESGGPGVLVLGEGATATTREYVVLIFIHPIIRRLDIIVVELVIGNVEMGAIVGSSLKGGLDRVSELAGASQSFNS